ncbi:MAG TPA: hypothetical protein VGH20_06930 [Myxococcales bacterium]|jgi:hypothetical protein
MKSIFVWTCAFACLGGCSFASHEADSARAAADAGFGKVTLAFKKPLPSFVAPSEPVTVDLQVTPAAAAPGVRWEVKPLGAAAAVIVDQGHGPRLVFRAASGNDQAGSRKPNRALQYEITARVDGEAIQTTLRVQQDEADVLRQEYADYKTAFQPKRKDLGALKHPRLNTGNYTLVAEEVSGTLDSLVDEVGAQVKALLHQRGLSQEFDLEGCVTSGFRNPQRNRAAGSIALNSLHVRGRAIDCDPRAVPIAGLTSSDMMCVVENAGLLAVKPLHGRAFTEKGAATFLECDSPAADHVHIER